jgi:predicted ATPase
VALRELIGVNALASDQRLSFGTPGLTIVYGDNGSGKSGYARVLKAALGPHVREEILRHVAPRAGGREGCPRQGRCSRRAAGGGRRSAGPGTRAR